MKAVQIRGGTCHADIEDEEGFAEQFRTESPLTVGSKEGLVSKNQKMILMKKMSEKSKEKVQVGKIDRWIELCHHAKARKVHQAATAPAIPLALITQFTPSFISILCAAQKIKLLIIAAIICGSEIAAL